MQREPVAAHFSFDDLLARSAASSAFARLCADAYGLDLTQHSLFGVDTAKLLTGLLCLGRSALLVDIGCGLGRITELVSDASGATCIGVDSASKAIACANRRTVQKRARLSFLTADMGRLPFGPGTTDAFLAVDSLYFAADLRGLLGMLASLLRHSGSVYALHMEVIPPSVPAEVNMPESAVPLGAVLKESGYSVHEHDITENAHLLCSKHHMLVLQMEESFRDEGNHDIFRGIRAEDERLLSLFQHGRIRRVLYQAPLR